MKPCQRDQDFVARCIVMFALVEPHVTRLTVRWRLASGLIHAASVFEENASASLNRSTNQPEHAPQPMSGQGTKAKCPDQDSGL